MARCFVALVPDPQWCRSAWQVLQAWSEGHRYRLVPWRQWHLTLAFLGNVPLELLTELAATVADLPPSPAEPLVCREMAYWAKPRVIVQKGDEAPRGWQIYVEHLRERVRRLCPVVEAQSWVPHVTLVRGVRETPRSLPCIPPSIWRERVVPILFRSRLTAHGACYERIMPRSGSNRPDAC